MFIMHNNISYNESRVLRILLEDSSLPISEISSRLTLNRNTVSNIIRKLNNNYIERYTVQIKEPENSLYIIAEIESLDGLDNHEIIEYYKLANGNYLAVMNRDALSSNIKYKNINIAYNRVLNSTAEKIDLYCDYCSGIITGKPQTIEMNSRKMYFCCETCKSEYLEKNNAIK